MFALGIVAALSAPFVMTCGFYIWEGLWKGSSLGLNVFKGFLATIIFLIIISILNLASGQSWLQHGGNSTDIGFLLLSSFIGISIGDTCWLQAMTMIGARRVIVVDVTKPFLAALVGYVGLNEPAGPFLFLGLALTMSGVSLVSFEQAATQQKLPGPSKKVLNDQEPPNTNEQAVALASNAADNNVVDRKNCYWSTQLALGYVFAFFNVLFDVLGSFLTRKYGTQLTTFDINAVRFGSAAVTLAAVGGAAKGFVARDSVWGVRFFGKTDWLAEMPRKSWMLVSAGVLFVTVACPALSNWALFQLPLSVCLCLTSVGPLYAIPMSLYLKKEAVTYRSVFGSVVACAGVVVLYVA
mmetsp:Transcript_15621/g.21011  ORF Transcript_15621/g.21011 Transcript_15621/m.21011 type:complete len:353 (-) Transcript_15621:125-1183(-)